MNKPGLCERSYFKNLFISVKLIMRYSQSVCQAGESTLE